MSKTEEKEKVETKEAVKETVAEAVPLTVEEGREITTSSLTFRRNPHQPEPDRESCDQRRAKVYHPCTEDIDDSEEEIDKVGTEECS